MRLALVIPNLRGGGAERVLSTMANFWAEKGWAIHLLTFDDGAEAPRYPLHPAVAHRHLAARRSRLKLLHILRRLIRLREAIQDVEPQAVISFLPQPNILTLLATRGLHIPVIVSERNDPSWRRIGLGCAGLRWLSYRWADALVTQTEEALDHFSGVIRKRGAVIPNPIWIRDPSERATLPKDKAAKVLLAMGRLVPQKGFDLLLAAFARIAVRHPDWSLEIWGEGPLRAELDAQARSIGPQVALPGWTAHPLAQMRRADLFVLSSRFEGFPNVLCEALVCGLPAVSFDCFSGPGTIIRHGIDGLLTPVGDVEALAAALDRLMTDELARRRLALRAPEIATRFSLPEVMTLWENLLASAVGQRTSARSVVPGVSSQEANRPPTSHTAPVRQVLVVRP